MICCATIILTLKLACTALMHGPALASASGPSCHPANQSRADRLLVIEVSIAASLLLFLCSAIWSLAFGQSPSALFASIHQIGCIALGKGGPG